MSKAVVKAIKEAVKDKSEVRLNIRLKRDGRFSSVLGFVKDIKVSLDGESYAVVQPSQKSKHVQSVLLKNVRAILKGGELIKK